MHNVSIFFSIYLIIYIYILSVLSNRFGRSLLALNFIEMLYAYQLILVLYGALVLFVVLYQELPSV